MFEGAVFSPDLKHGRASGILSVREGCIECAVESGPTFSLPASACSLELGGASGRMWFCHNADRSLTLCSEADGFGAALRALPELQAQWQAIDARRQRTRSRERSFWVVALTCLALLLLGAYFGIREGALLALRAVPVSVDERLGDQAFESMPLGGPRVRDEALQAGLEQIVQRLSEQARPGGFRFRVHVVEAKTVNAFALPGGNMVVYTGLLRAASDASEVAGVLGHEMAHVTQRHSMQRIAHSLGIAAALNVILGDPGGLAAIGAEMIRAGTLTSYDRDQEREADLEGVRMVHAAGLDPLGLARFFETLEREAPAMPEALSWLSSHPHSAERQQAVRARARELGPTAIRPLSIDWADLQRRAAAQ